MKNLFQLLTVAFFSLFLILFGCGKDETPEFEDYREEFVGTYDCTKSSKSFDDNLFTTDIEVVVQIDSTSDTTLMINDQIIPVNEDGVFGPEFYSGQYFDLMFDGDKIRLSINEVFPNGLALPCFIKGEK